MEQSTTSQLMKSDMDDKEATITYCDSTISKIISECWSQAPEERPKFFEICTLLNKKLIQIRSQNVIVDIL